MGLEKSYDAKLNNATYDALKAFQLNTINNDSSQLVNSKLRDIEASVNTFFTSIASNFNMVGYNKDVLIDYVPALVYTMYDGYYIYSPYTNTLDDTNKNSVMETNLDGTMTLTEKSDAEILDSTNQEATFKQGEKLSDLKPYIYYSRRYQKGDDDFVITYSLDNYITIQGKINGKGVFDAGYLINPNNITIKNGQICYRDVPINNNETLKETIYDPLLEDIKEYEYIKINNSKFYKGKKIVDGNVTDEVEWFVLNNGEREGQKDFDPKANPATEYYKDAYNFTQKLLNSTYSQMNDDLTITPNLTGGYDLQDLKSVNAKDVEGQEIASSSTSVDNYEIFDQNGKSLEDPDSNFNQQRLEVIRYSIEKNLSTAIANYNNYSNVSTNFLMPKLKEDEWDKIINNVSIISFLQGLNIGGKIYNGYSIITNNKNKEVVNENSIYITTEDGYYHRPNEKNLTGNIKEGYLNIDFEKKSYQDGTDGEKYYFSRPELGSYTSIVTQSNVDSVDNYYAYMDKIAKDNINNPKGKEIASAYFTALGRERYGLYRPINNSLKLTEKFGKGAFTEEMNQGNTGP